MKKGVMLVDISARAFRKNFGLFVIVSLLILSVSVVLVFGNLSEVNEEVVVEDKIVVDGSVKSLVEGIDNSLVDGEIRGGYGSLVGDVFEETAMAVFEEQSEENPSDLSGLKLVNRTSLSNTYFVSENRYVTELYTIPINMKDIKGEYKPYEEVTSFSYDDDSLILEWNGKSVKLNLYTQDNQKIKERFKDKSNEEKQELDFNTRIEKGKGNYYFDHTLNKAKQPKKIGYDIETNGVSCYGEGYSLICDEQKINFRDAVVKQGLNVEIDNDGRYLEISGDDLSYIDPSVVINSSDFGFTDTYCFNHNNATYSYTEFYLNRIGSNDSIECHGLIQFDVQDELPESVTSVSLITSVYLHIKYRNGTSEESNGAFTEFCVIENLEDYDWTPSNALENEQDYERLDDCSLVDKLFDYSFPENTDAWYSKRIDNLDPDVARQLIEKQDGSPSAHLGIGMEGEFDLGDNEWVNFYRAGGGSPPYLIVSYVLPDIVISVSAVGEVTIKPYVISDNTPLANITTDINGDCRASIDGDESYNEMSDDVDCSGDGGKAHSCQFGSLSDGVTKLYFACNSSAGAESTSVTNAEANITIYSSPPPGPLSWPVCNPADPCCDQDGNLRANGYVCKSAHNAVCNDSGGCGGYAYEDRCDGSNSLCPDSNDFIEYDGVCDDVVCSSKSCSSYTFQPERSCLSGSCQTNDAYACPNNLNCLDASSCKKEAISVSDCRTGFLFDNDYNVCWLNESDKSPYGMRYDDNGNLISGFGLNYSYNGFNWLVNVTLNDGSLVAEYWYDDSGVRVKSVVYSGSENETTYYFGDFVQIVNSSGVFNETYYYFYDKLVGLKSNDGSLLFYHPDHLGSSTLITNSSGGVVSELEYEPFGSLVEGSDERYLYEGKELDDTGLYYFGARYYDPDLAKFVEPDSLVSNIYDPQQLNLYGFERNSPYNYKDTTGEYFETVVDVGFIIYDIKEISRDPSLLNFVVLGADVAGAALPFATGLGMGVKGGVKGVKALDKAGDVGKVLKSARKIKPYKEAQKLTKGFKGELQAHHLIEVRHLEKVLDLGKQAILEAPSKILEKSKHLDITKRLRKELPYGKSFSKKEISKVYKEVYKESKDILKAIGGYLT